mgnify:FL=1
MEAIIWIAAAIIVYFTGTGKKQGQGKERKEKVYLGCSLFAALCCEFAIKVVFHIHYLSIWLILTYALIAAQCSRMLWIFICIPEKRKQVYSMSIKMAVGMGILAFYYVNLSRDVIGVTKIANQFPPVSTGMADLMLLAATAIWIYGTDVLRRFPECARAIYWIFLAITPFLAFFLEELCWNPSVTGISLLNGELNVLIYLILEVIFVCLMQKGTLGLQALYIFAWLVGALNYYLLKFRGQPFLATDIFALRTAMSVAGQYTFEVAEELAFTFLILYFLFTCMWALGKMEIFQKRTGKKRILIKGCGAIGAAAALFFWIGRYDFPDTYNIWIDFWAQVNTYQTTGFAPAFISFWQRMKISKPDGYTEQSAEQIFDEYGAVEAPAETEKKDTGEQPMIITIMNESFSDLSVLGPLACTEDDLSFFHSLKDDPHIIEYGWDYVSTRGGGTSTTEFEYLTGDSMTYTNGINPYSSFDFTNVPSMVSILKEQGYHTIAMHPENPENWRRSVVYPKLGFDEFLSISAFEDSERTVWNRVSDLGDYQKLIEVYETQTEPTFIFNVTMQNHGGYDGIGELKPEEIVDVDEEYSGYSDLQMYESLIAKSDQALSYLISYFEQVDRPVLICFFGDHQPALNGDFENALREAGREDTDTDLTMTEKIYTVPYFIWSNYEIPEDYSMKNSRGEDVVSTNYLGTLVRKYAGLELSAYDRYRMNQREQIPVFNFAGYMTADGDWHDLWAENSYREWIERYRTVQYYALFDRKRNGRYFVGE